MLGNHGSIGSEIIGHCLRSMYVRSEQNRDVSVKENLSNIVEEISRDSR